MVLESLVSPWKAEREPWEMFFVGLLYSSVAVLLSLWIFKESASLVMVFLTAMAAIPLLYRTIKIEEFKGIRIAREGRLLKEHGRALSFFMFLFLGITVSFTSWYVLLPTDMLNNLFGTQTQTIVEISNRVTGNVSKYALLSKIFLNNIKVLAFCILFSFLYGAGAIFVLTWNASVIGTAIGNFIRSNIEQYASSIGIAKVVSYFHIVSIGLLKYTIHGIPEILAYFVGALAGGIISIAVIRHDFRTKRFEKIIIDSADLLLISFVLLLIAAVLEVYVTPALF